VQRASRKGSWTTAALVGYTNAGKSTLLNRLAGADAYTQDQLFATLDPLTRRWDLGEGEAVLLTDTVGFIHKLPTGLVAAFRATLEEVRSADILIHMVNAAHPGALAQAAVALAEVSELGAAQTPIVTVLNKLDALQSPDDGARLAALQDAYPDAIALSARTGQGCDDLAARLRSLVAALRLQETGTDDSYGHDDTGTSSDLDDDAWSMTEDTAP
jgi:GTP-binding protein HflX